MPAYHTYPTHLTHSASSNYDRLSSSVDIPGVRRSSNAWMMIPKTKFPATEGQLKRLTIAYPHESLERPIRGNKTWRTTIEMIPEDTLLEIFDFYRLDAMKRSSGGLWTWHRLAHVCQKWRHVISVSPRRLDLRILCQYGTPIEYFLDFWPTLPLAVRLNASRQPSNHMPRNIMLTLRHPYRLCEIDLRVPSSMTGPIVEMVPKPCSVLEKIRIVVKDTTGPSIPVFDEFLGGSAPHLREIKLDGISFPFPEIRRVLSSTNFNLVQLHLSKIPHAVYFSPDDLVTALSTLVQLKRLTVDFHSPASSPPPNMTRRPLQRTTLLPSLGCLHFQGTSEYLEEFVAQIHSPALCNIAIHFFNQIFFDIPQFSEFISQLKVLGYPTW